jgi:hypothetical protein
MCAIVYLGLDHVAVAHREHCHVVRARVCAQLGSERLRFCLESGLCRRLNMSVTRYEPCCLGSWSNAVYALAVGFGDGVDPDLHDREGAQSQA